MCQAEPSVLTIRSPLRLTSSFISCALAHLINVCTIDTIALVHTIDNIALLQAKAAPFAAEQASDSGAGAKSVGSDGTDIWNMWDVASLFRCSAEVTGGGAQGTQSADTGTVDDLVLQSTASTTRTDSELGRYRRSHH